MLCFKSGKFQIAKDYNLEKNERRVHFDLLKLTTAQSIDLVLYFDLIYWNCNPPYEDAVCPGDKIFSYKQHFDVTKFIEFDG